MIPLSESIFCTCSSSKAVRFSTYLCHSQLRTIEAGCTRTYNCAIGSIEKVVFYSLQYIFGLILTSSSASGQVFRRCLAAIGPSYSNDGHLITYRLSARLKNVYGAAGTISKAWRHWCYGISRIADASPPGRLSSILQIFRRA